MNKMRRALARRPRHGHSEVCNTFSSNYKLLSFSLFVTTRRRRDKFCRSLSGKLINNTCIYK
jgi:hypothetical protein